VKKKGPTHRERKKKSKKRVKIRGLGYKKKGPPLHGEEKGESPRIRSQKQAEKSEKERAEI